MAKAYTNSRSVRGFVKLLDKKILDDGKVILGQKLLAVKTGMDYNIVMDLLSTSQVAERLGITRQGVAYLLKEQIMKGERVGRVWVIRKNEVERVAALKLRPGPKGKVK